MSLPPISTIPALDTARRASILDSLFEPCTALHTLSVELLRTQPFSSYDDLIASIGVQLSDLLESASTSDTNWLDTILGAHPRLGAQKVDSEQSRSEQAQLNQGGAEEARDLLRANQRYESRFPGLKYVVFVNGRSRPEILADMDARITRSNIQAERASGIKAMCQIAADRARKML